MDKRLEHADDWASHGLYLASQIEDRALVMVDRRGEVVFPPRELNREARR